jgi:hypothetical protein
MLARFTVSASRRLPFDQAKREAAGYVVELPHAAAAGYAGPSPEVAVLHVEPEDCAESSRFEAHSHGVADYGSFRWDGPSLCGSAVSCAESSLGVASCHSLASHSDAKDSHATAEACVESSQVVVSLPACSPFRPWVLCTVRQQRVPAPRPGH